MLLSPSIRSIGSITRIEVDFFERNRRCHRRPRSKKSTSTLLTIAQHRPTSG